MKKIFLSLIVINSSMSLANAQDFVIMKTVMEIRQKCLEITMDEVKYGCMMNRWCYIYRMDPTLLRFIMNQAEVRYSLKGDAKSLLFR